MTTPNLSLKLLVDKKVTRVVFAEGGKSFVDFLFNLLSLPIGTVIKALKNGSMVGCIGNLYGSLENLNEAYMQPNENKGSLLNPRIPAPATEAPLLLPDSNPQPIKTKLLYRCPNHHPCVTDSKDYRCPWCSNNMSEQVAFIGMNDSAANSTSQGGYVKDLVTYMVTDDLSVSIMSMISGVAPLNKFNVKDLMCLRKRWWSLGLTRVWSC
ncbi:hypothetical protein MANES_07G110700v8 [Manihot esculenta]|uniref:Uncharacterized protein n=2 Tax=Manihot esculenta TaxID=3983 RepID=A0ACB7HGL6_MANES|nr:hypothetical protein MANES_07G110700v8 [Manihot esculenta]